MSLVVRELLQQLGLLDQTTHEDRIEIDREVERRTGLPCDEGAKQLSESEFLDIVYLVLKKRGRKPVEEAMYA